MYVVLCMHKLTFYKPGESVFILEGKGLKQRWNGMITEANDLRFVAIFIWDRIEPY